MGVGTRDGPFMPTVIRNDRQGEQDEAKVPTVALRCERCRAVSESRRPREGTRVHHAERFRRCDQSSTRWRRPELSWVRHIDDEHDGHEDPHERRREDMNEGHEYLNPCRIVRLVPLWVSSTRAARLVLRVRRIKPTHGVHKRQISHMADARSAVI